MSTCTTTGTLRGRTWGAAAFLPDQLSLVVHALVTHALVTHALDDDDGRRRRTVLATAEHWLRLLEELGTTASPSPPGRWSPGQTVPALTTTPAPPPAPSS